MTSRRVEPQRDQPTGAVVLAALWMTGALFSLMAMAVSGRQLSAELGTFQILFFRSLVGLLVVSAVIWPRGWGQIRTGRPGLHLMRNLAHYGGQFGWFYGLAFIPLAEVFAIEFTVPIWTAVWAMILLGERLTRPRVAAIVLGILGLLVILRPGFQAVQPAALAVLFAAVCYALTHVLTKQIARYDTPMTVLFYMTAIQLPLGLILSVRNWVTPSPALWPWVLAVGVTALSAHYCITRALSLADATVVVPMDFLRLPLSAVIGFLLYDEALDWLVLAGAGLMLAGNWVNIRAEQRRARQGSPSAHATPPLPGCIPFSGAAVQHRAQPRWREPQNVVCTPFAQGACMSSFDPVTDLARFFARLSPREQEAFLLRYRHGASLDHVAATLKCDQAEARTLLQAGRAQLAEALGTGMDMVVLGSDWLGEIAPAALRAEKSPAWAALLARYVPELYDYARIQCGRSDQAEAVVAAAWQAAAGYLHENGDATGLDERLYAAADQALAQT